MLDLLSPLRGYIAQSLQFYLSKYIEDIQLERLGLFGGDLVLNDLKIKRHVLRESLDIPSSFDFSRGFIRELRIHIPWTQLLSQPIEVKLYTIELILTAKNEQEEQRAARGSTVDTAGAAAVEEEEEEDEEEERSKMEHPKSGWIHDTLQTILSNVSVQVNNLVLKYEHDDIVFSIALGTLDFYSASESSGWKRCFDQLKGKKRVICKSVDAKDVTIFLDRYMSARRGTAGDPVRRNVIGYEVPVLSRTSASVRAKLQLFSTTASGGQNDRSNSPSFSRSPVHQQRNKANHDVAESSMFGEGGLCAYRPSKLCDPFYSYSCRRSRVTPMYEVDVFIGKLSFSVSDRQLEMLNQLIKSASGKMKQSHELPFQKHNPDHVPSGGKKAKRPSVSHIPAISAVNPSGGKKMNRLAKKQESWLGWAMNALGTAGDGKEEDALVSELLAETRMALLKVQPPSNHGDEDPLVINDTATKIFCVRLCISSTSMMLRKHESTGQEVEHQDFATTESGEELVPVANLGMVRVIAQKTRRKVARPAVPILSMSLSYVAIEALLPRKGEQNGLDLVLEIDKVELTSTTVSENREELTCKKGQILLTWGSTDSVHVPDCVSHPYFTNSFFDEEATRWYQREERSSEIVKVGLDAGVPAWKTLEPSRNLGEHLDLPSTLSLICQDTIRIIGIKERILDEGILSNAVSTAWASHDCPIVLSEGMTRSLVSIAKEYRVYRNPDVGALDNLTRLLRPQLNSLFARYTLHSCSASSLFLSSDGTNVQCRSVHSALRLHLALTSTSTHRNEPSASSHTNEKKSCKVLDLSIGAVHAMLDPSKCLETMEALSIIVRGGEANKGKTGTANPRSMTSDTPHAAHSTQSALEKDVKLITASSIHICLPDQSAAEKKEDKLEVSSRNDLIVIARDFAWSGASNPGRNERRQHLGTLSVHLKRPSGQLTPMTLVEALGLDYSVTNSSADGDDYASLCANLAKLKLGISASAAQDVASMINSIASPFGYPVTWEPLVLTPKLLRTAFQIETCGAGVSRAVCNRPRLVMAQRQSFSAEVASISANLIRAGRRSEVILQGGIAPTTAGTTGLTTPLLKLEVLQEQSPGALIALPLLRSLGLFSMTNGPLAAACVHYHLAMNAQLARVFVDVQGVLQTVDATLSLVQGVQANLPPQKELGPEVEDCERDAMAKDGLENGLADWSFKINLKAAGADIRLNEALQLKVPLLSVSSVNVDTGQLAHVKAGGALKIECAMKDVTISASENGVLKDVEDSNVLSIQGIHVSIDISHSLADCRHTFAVDTTLCVSSVQASLSRLKHYISKVKAEPRNLLVDQVPEQRKPDESEIGSRETMRSQWYWRLGAQVDHVGIACTAEISRQSFYRNQRTRVVVDGKIVSLAVAARVGNHHPVRNDLHPATGCTSFTDFQATVGDVQVVEKLQNVRREIHTAFGEFLRLQEHAFLGILVCLDLSDLQRLTETISVSNSFIPDQQSLPPAMLSWHLTSCLAKSFHEAHVKQLRSVATSESLTAEIPLIISWIDSALTASPFPLLSVFYRNYSEAGLPRHVFAGSAESVDAAVTTSSLYCLASLMDVGDELASLFSLKSRTRVSKFDDSTTRAPSLPDAVPRVSLATIEVSVSFGCIRLFLPSEFLMDGIMLARPVSGNAFVVLESLSVASAVRNDISLDGLGYPPFNSRVLPRRATVQAQRFGQSQLRIGCRAGKITGHIAQLEFNEFVSAGKMHEEIGPFERHIGRVAGHVAHFSDVVTFWSPLNVTCSLEEESFATNEEGPAIPSDPL
uniref:Chorein N-terminal domain-containing protein n=1 Tax=Hyaloperonospora arabidopsidis (strain Emoy2) TaxID=559515 RepID=M4BW50_HYAAE